MYKHHVKACLALICAIVVFSGGVAFVDPFNNQQAGLNWLVLAGLGTAGAFWGLIKNIVDTTGDDKKFFGNLGGFTLGMVAIGTYATATAAQYTSKAYVPLVWTAFVFMVLMFILASLIGYLVEPQPEAVDHELQKTT